MDACELSLQRYGPYRPNFNDSSGDLDGLDPLTVISGAALSDRFLVVGSAGKPGHIQVIPITRGQDEKSAGYSIDVCDAIVALSFTPDEKELIILGRQGPGINYLLFTCNATEEWLGSPKVVTGWTDGAHRREAWIVISSKSNFIAAVIPIANREGNATIRLFEKAGTEWKEIGLVTIPVQGPRPLAKGRITNVVL